MDGEEHRHGDSHRDTISDHQQCRFIRAGEVDSSGNLGKKLVPASIGVRMALFSQGKANDVSEQPVSQ
jgi:hypothetical protein